MFKFFTVLLAITLLFSSCKLTVNGKKNKAPETREERLGFYRTQIVGLEAEIDYHFKHRMDFNLKADYVKLEECLKGLSSLLEKPEQDIIEEIISDMNKAIVNFNKTKSFVFFSRSNESVFSKLRKIKKTILKKEKNKSVEKEKGKTEEPIKEENTGKDK